MKYTDFLSDKEVMHYIQWYDSAEMKEAESLVDPAGQELKHFYPAKDDAKMPNLAKMHWKLDLSVQDAYDLYTYPELLKVSKVIVDYDIVEELEVNDPKLEEARIVYGSSLKPAMMVYPRDFCVVQYTRWTDPNDHSKGFVQINKSITYEKCPELPKTHVRAQRVLVMSCEPVANEPKKSVIKIITYTDLAGWIPQGLIGQFLKQHPKKVLEEFKTRIEALAAWKVKNGKK